MPNEHRAIRTRLDFSKIPTAIQIPNLIEVQRRSYERFSADGQTALGAGRQRAAVRFCLGFSHHRFPQYLAAGLCRLLHWQLECKCGHLKDYITCAPPASTAAPW